MNREKRLENVIKKVMRIWLTWGGHMKNWQRPDVQKVEWKRGRGRPRLLW